MNRYYFNVFADYFQFDLLDEGIETNIVSWDEEALRHRTIVNEGAVTISTARNMTVPVLVEICGFGEEHLGAAIDSWDHVVECSIHIPSGRLVIFGNEYRPLAPRIDLPPGIYQVQVFFGGLSTLSKDGLHGSDVYLIVLQQGVSTPLRVIKQYQSTN